MKQAWVWILVGLVAAGAAQAQEEKNLLAEARAIFEARCTGCHGAENQKAELRLDTAEGLAKGGKSGVIFAAGNPDESAIIARVTKPEGEDGAMPPKGERLTPEQVESLRGWISAGATTEGWDAAKPEEPKQMVYASVSVRSAAETAALLQEERLKALGEGVDPAPEAAVAAIHDAGGFAAPIDQNSNLLQVDLKFLPGGATDEHLALLAPLAGHITWLDLSGTGVTDAGLAQLAALGRLTSLHLERTGISDAGLAHLKGLQHLEYLNLYGTKVTGAGVEQLAELKQLRRLYLWQTEVTREQAEKLAAALPEATINLGTELIEAKPVEYNDPAEDLKKMEEEAAPAEEPAAPAFDPFAPAAPDAAPAAPEVVDPFVAPPAEEAPAPAEEAPKPETPAAPPIEDNGDTIAA
ncbi:MAG: c-type cytochrome [Candidatus Hydrogenedens sp.]|nr:c-type cytochrome [Candidatus Hydrogenedens sp.]